MSLLEIARGHVIDDRVAEDVVQCLALWNVFSAPAYHDGKFDLIVEPAGDPRIDLDPFIRADDVAVGPPDKEVCKRLDQLIELQKQTNAKLDNIISRIRR